MTSRTFWALVVGLLLGAASTVGAQAFQAVLLHVGTPGSPTALSATNGALNVNCQ